MSYFSDLLTSIFEKKTYFKNFIRKFEKDKDESLSNLTNMILKNKGEVSSIVYAETLLNIFNNLKESEKKEYFLELLENYNIEVDKLNKFVINYKKNKSLSDFKNISSFCEPRWLELFRKINAAPEATFHLVKMRETLNKFTKEHQELKKIDIGFQKLFQNWFNPGFLVLKPIDWNTPANILEKIIEYEAVHEISSWDDLRARLAPKDRKCFAFFHPAIYEEPLIFVEIALMQQIPDRISLILNKKRKEINPHECNSAIFYSISNCQPGLKGVSFGNFLLKNVANQLQQNFSNIENYSTLSPIPNFYDWMLKEDKRLKKDFSTSEIIKFVKNNKNYLLKKVFSFLTISNREDKHANDSVSRFHLGNGAIIDRVNYLADNNPNNLRKSMGFMVNYRYILENLEKNHEEYHSKRNILFNSDIKKMLKSI